MEQSARRRSSSERPSFLQPAYDLSPVAPLGHGLGRSPTPDALEMPEMPMPLGTAEPSARPPSASGERSQRLSAGFIKVSEVEATQRLNAALEQDNEVLSEQLAAAMDRNAQLRANIAIMEQLLATPEVSEAAPDSNVAAD
mmetsp:Transcript_8236/g.14763  ORF Transcript_8236/g.14763 Transcript_8236/m.14763 type:complete len:141 (+) Transcript_8236:83-505(+)